MEIKTIPALRDNYIYIVSDYRNRAVVVDPGDADAALAALAQYGYDLSAVLLTHRHADHIDGVGALLEKTPEAGLYAPDGCGFAQAVICAADDTVSLLDGALSLRVIATPGHTLEHIAYAGEGIVFSGDTLFIGGCGRVFEGTMRQMHDSLSALAALPDETEIYCGHEYTVNNLRFAAAVEPDNAPVAAALQALSAQAAQERISVPGSIGQERQINPFLRLKQPAVIAAAEAHSKMALSDSVAVFGALRQWKDSF